MRKPAVGVIGSSSPTPEQDQKAEAVGRLIAERGGIVVCGGLGGVMEAACRGAKAKGGLTIGIIPTASRTQANAYVEIAIATGMGQSRNVIIVQSADVCIAVGGEYGTLSEIGHALRANIQVIGLGTWDATNGTKTSLPIVRADTPEQAVELAFERIQKNQAAASEAPAQMSSAVQSPPHPSSQPLSTGSLPSVPQEEPKPSDIIREVH